MAIIIYILILSLHLAVTVWDQPLPAMVTKPLLMICLVFAFFQNMRFPHPLKKYIFLALLFSWSGDVLLMFQEKDSLFFIGGLASFLIAHVFYILYFTRIRTANQAPPQLHKIALFICLSYSVGLVTLLLPKLGSMTAPVILYALVITVMLLCCLHAFRYPLPPYGKWCLAGTLLFVLSDSVLAINKFYHPFKEAGFIIMLTYGLAQLFIVTGAIKNLRPPAQK